MTFFPNHFDQIRLGFNPIFSEKLYPSATHLSLFALKKKVSHVLASNSMEIFGFEPLYFLLLLLLNLFENFVKIRIAPLFRYPYG